MGKTDGVGLIHCNADVSRNLNHGLQICITLLDRNLQRICFFFIHKELRSRQIRAWRYLFHIFHMPFFAANTWQGSCYLTTMWSRREVRNYKTHFSLSADVGHRSIYLKIDRFLVHDQRYAADIEEREKSTRRVVASPPRLVCVFPHKQ